MLSGQDLAAQSSMVPAIAEPFRTLNPSRWLVSDGWSGGDWMINDWRRGQVRFGRGGLVMTLAKNEIAKRGFSSAEVQSQRTFGYGYYEARMTAAKGGGLDTGFFTYVGPPNGKPWNEVDFEILGKNTRAVQVTYHTGVQQVATTLSLPFDAAEAPHSFGFDWQRDHIRWYIDGKMVHEETGGRLPLPSEPQKVFFNLWASNANPAWLGRFDPAGAPYGARVTCFAATASYTRPLC